MQENYLRHPTLKRALIMSAGSLFNIIFAFLIFIPVFLIGKHLSFIDAILMSIKTIWTILSGTVAFLFNIFSGNGSMEGFAGPVGIASIAGQAASKGFLNLMYFTGIFGMMPRNNEPFPTPCIGRRTIVHAPYRICQEETPKPEDLSGSQCARSVTIHYPYCSCNL